MDGSSLGATDATQPVVLSTDAVEGLLFSYLLMEVCLDYVRAELSHFRDAVASGIPADVSGARMSARLMAFLSLVDLDPNIREASQGGGKAIRALWPSAEPTLDESRNMIRDMMSRATNDVVMRAQHLSMLKRDAGRAKA